MTLLDANALIAAFAGEPAADRIREILRAGEARMSVSNLAEVYDRLMRTRKMPLSEVHERIDALKRVRRLNIIDLDQALAARAGELRADHYDSRRCRVSMADCVAAATAEQLNDALITSDTDLAAMAREIGVDVTLLSTSSG